MESNVNGRRQYIAVTILFLINLLNYVDRYTVAGVLISVQDYYNIGGTMAGLIQTVFLISFMLFSPICGYLGDRFNRKVIILAGMIVWLAAVVASTFVPADWGVRVSGIIGVIVFILHIFFVYEPERGDGEKALGAQVTAKQSTYWEDLKALVSIPTYISCMWGYTALVFASGTLIWWEPAIIEHLTAWKHNLTQTDDLSKSEKQKIGFFFGLITLASGLIGVTVGSLLSTAIRQGSFCFKRIKTERAPPLVSGGGALIAAPLLLVVLLFGDQSMTLLWILMFMIITALCFNWGLNIDMLMTVIVPCRRNTAFSYMMLISHLFGDASGPYLIGMVSDMIRNGNDDPESQYYSLIKACFVAVGLLLISAALYFVCSLVLIRDQAKFREEMGMTDTPLANNGSTESLDKTGLEKVPIKSVKEATV
ncbi:hypothetical protein WR25_05538 [Diploscapter pachys]|uniref:Major facilitator superfamily (MFS) profile domain-containing protein n=1 Tax=Diploscapter pachys TaxID=2018661 RepID=A0A2A2JLM1_9BILA|nr:hypothetical protein WR25_05538 [Diploscapter pachys]